MIVFRPATFSDVEHIHKLLNYYAKEGLMLPRARNAIYENLRDYILAVENNRLLGCGALHFVWDRFAEIRSLAVTESHQKRGIGALLVESCLDEAASLEIGKVFVHTYQAGFCRKMGFVDTDKQNLPHKIWSDCLHCPKFPDCDEDALIHTNTGPHTGG